MLHQLLGKFRKARRLVSRTRWTARLLRLPAAPAGEQPGLVVVQIDGLSRTQFERALARGRMPFLKKLIRRGYYAPTSFYSGCPSTTPAVQGEVMYGQRCAVPAFEFFIRKTGRIVRMFESDVAREVARRLAAQSEPLLTGGASYSNIYSGGAEEARFCAETLEDDKRRLITRPWQALGVAVLYGFTILRVLALAILELVIAIGDLLRGVVNREDWRLEAKMLNSRVGVSIVLREYLRVTVKLAIEQGAPIVYANFLGYDEQAHRRGPGSWFAHWVLKGIDDVIGDVARAARRSPARDYEVVVFSDHGQEHADDYEELHGRSIQDAVRATLFEHSRDAAAKSSHPDASRRGWALDQRARRMLGVKRGRELMAANAVDLATDEPVVTALGPLGHIYLAAAMSDEGKQESAEKLVRHAHVPLVLYVDGGGSVWAHTARGRWRLPDDAAQVLGADHPFAADAAEDLIALCRHADAGDLVISGWVHGQPPITFVEENGSHGSVGPDELRGFALIPDGLRMHFRATRAGESYIRGEDLYHACLAFLGGSGVVRSWSSATPRPDDAERASIRVMTYNVHSCIGMDGKLRPQRIAQVIRSAGADIVALQEVDANRRRTNSADQALVIAEQLEMSHHYFAVLDHGGERYGLAILSRWPLRHVQSTLLTHANPQRRSEARGAMWAEVATPLGCIQVLNTHFGLTRAERLRQAAILVGDDWLGRIDGDRPAVVCGDLNAGPGSPPYRALAARLIDAPARIPGQRPRATFPSPLPARRLDHIFVTPQFSVLAVNQPRTPTAVLASDHLPICVDLALAPAPTDGEPPPETCRAAAAVSPIQT